jgi:hypothetical protein
MHLLILALLLTYYLFVKEGLNLQNYKNIKPHQVLIIVTILIILYSEYKHENLLKQFESFDVKKLPKLNVNAITSKNFMLYDKKAFVNTNLRVIFGKHIMLIDLKNIPDKFSTHMYYANDDKKKSQIIATYSDGTKSNPISLKNNSWYKLEFNKTTPIKVRYIANPTNNTTKVDHFSISPKTYIGKHTEGLFYETESSEMSVNAMPFGKLNTNVYYRGNVTGEIKSRNVNMMLYSIPAIKGTKNTPRTVNIKPNTSYQITHDPFTCKLQK